MVLTSIPFLYHFLIKPRRESVKKYRNVFTAAQPHMSKLKKSVWRIGTHLINFYDKMKHREKPRKFFTLLLLLLHALAEALGETRCNTVISIVVVVVRMGEDLVDRIRLR